MNFDILRQKILEKAIRGELVPQLESEPEVSQIGEVSEDVPFAIPKKWKWVRVSDVSHINPKVTAQTSNTEVSFIPMAALSAGYVNQIALDTTRLWGAVKNGYTKFADGDILLAKITPCFQNRKSAIARKLSNGIGCGSSEFHILRVSENIVTQEYLLMFLKSQWFITYGVENFKGTAGQQRLGTSELKNCLFSLPPLSEQHRIVAKVNQLFNLIDCTENAYNELSGPLSERFRQLCLEKAIQGKLVPQLESEPEVGQIGEVPEDVPFLVPEKWKWCNFGNVVAYGKCEQVQPQNIEEDAWILDLEDIESGTGNLLQKKKGISVQSNKSRFKKGDVLYSKLRPYLNKVIVADDDGYCTTEIVPISLSVAQAPLEAQYLKIYLMSPYFVGYANQCSYGVKMPRLGTKDAKKALFPIPPIEEQRRIVAKLNELLGSVSQLERTISTP